MGRLRDFSGYLDERIGRVAEIEEKLGRSTHEESIRSWLDELKVNLVAPVMVARRFAGHVANALSLRLKQHGYEVVYLAVIAVVFGLGVGAIAWLGAHQVWAGALTVGSCAPSSGSLPTMFRC